MPRIVAARLGPVKTIGGDTLDPDATQETMPSCLFDAVAIPDGQLSGEALAALGHAVEFAKDQYRHCKALLANGHGRVLLDKATIPLEGDNAALFMVDRGDPEAGIEDFIAAVGRHRNWDRATDPPAV